jgi:NAD(P)-dependent dehydrogenase (short-subunit alcohol dehydrogenase family)
VIAYTQAMNRELGEDGIRSVALCPGWVDTRMTDFIKDEVPAAEMIRPADVAAAVRFVLGLSAAAVVPEIVFERPGGGF